MKRLPGKMLKKRGNKTSNPNLRKSSSAHVAPQSGDVPQWLRDLRTLAKLFGIQTCYLDTEGKLQWASPDTLKALLTLWGIEAHDNRSVHAAMLEEELRCWRECLEPAYVMWDRKPATVELRLRSEAQPERLPCTLVLEDGTKRSLEVVTSRLRTFREVLINDQSFVAKRLPLPALPLGYHQLTLHYRGKEHRSMIISAPRRSYTPEEDIKRLGVFLPMYAAHSESSWGAGNLGDWKRLSAWIADAGGHVVSSLPLTAAFLDAPACEPSPYSPASRLFWNEFYLDVESLPEFASCKKARELVQSRSFQQQVKSFRADERVNYCEQAKLRRRVLELLAASFFERHPKGNKDFDRFLAERPAAQQYATFRAACDKLRSSWHAWELRLKQGKLQKGDYSVRDQQYHLYAQWQAQRQFSDYIEKFRNRGFLFYLDLPLGVNPDGYDIWCHRDSFAFPASAGAPPDSFFTKGQNWGFAPLHPRHVRERNYDYVLDYLRFQMRHTGMLRIDHVMALHRLYWIPRNFPASAGAYVSYPADELFGLLCLESHRHKTVLVGENLGTVPPEVNQAMATHHVRETFVVQYEVRPKAAAAVRPAPLRSVASLNTHDMPTFTAFWDGKDIDDRADLGLLTKAEAKKAVEERNAVKTALAAFLRAQGWLKGERSDAANVLNACHGWLAASNSELALVNLEDLWGETRPQNTPGTSTERPNWRRKARLNVGEIESSEGLRTLLSELARLRSQKK